MKTLPLLLSLALAGTTEAQSPKTYTPATPPRPDEQTILNARVVSVDAAGRRLTVRGVDVKADGGRDETLSVAAPASDQLAGIRPGMEVLLVLRGQTIVEVKPAVNSGGETGNAVQGAAGTSAARRARRAPATGARTAPRPAVTPQPAGVPQAQPVPQPQPLVSPQPVTQGGASQPGAAPPYVNQPAPVGTGIGIGGLAIGTTASPEAQGTPFPTPRPVPTPVPVGSPPSVAPAPTIVVPDVRAPAPVLVPGNAPTPVPTPANTPSPATTPTPSPAT